MTYFTQAGRDWFASETAPEFKEELPVGTYMLNYSERRGFYLSEIDPFTLPSKTYGKEIDRHQRIIDTFLSRPNSTGVILAGEKGAGKTLLAKRVSIELAKAHNIPTIIINAAHHGDQFNQFIQSISQPAMILFDEFEKVYGSEYQDALLTVLDGTMQSRKLFIVAINDTHQMSRYMINRPGRFFYLFNYEGMPEDAVRAFLDDNLKDKSRLESVVTYARIFGKFTFDMLTAIVEEMNRYDESLNDVLKNLNVNMRYGGSDVFEVTNVVLKDLDPKEGELGWDKDSIASNNDGRDFNHGRPVNPFRDEVTQTVYMLVKSDDESAEPHSEARYIDINPGDIVSADKDGNYVFDNESVTITIMRKRENLRSIESLFA